MRVWTSSTPPVGPLAEQPGRRGRAATAPARVRGYRGASSSSSKARNATSRTGRGRRLDTRCSTASVPTITGASPTLGGRVDLARLRTCGTSAATSSRTACTPGRNARNLVAPQCAHTGGRVVPQRGHTKSCSGCATAAPQVVQRVSSRARAAREDPGPAPPVDHADGAPASSPPPSTARCSAGPSAARQQADPRRLVAQVDDLEPGPAPAQACGGARRDGDPRRAARVERGRRAHQRRPARRRAGRARAPTSRACHVGARSSWNASSLSSSTTTARRSGIGSHTDGPAPHHHRGPAPQPRPRASVRSRSARAPWSVQRPHGPSRAIAATRPPARAGSGTRTSVEPSGGEERAHEAHADRRPAAR